MITKDNFIILSIMLCFFSIMIYSWITNNFLAKTFILGLEGCHMFFVFVIQKLF